MLEVSWVSLSLQYCRRASALGILHLLSVLRYSAPAERNLRNTTIYGSLISSRQSAHNTSLNVSLVLRRGPLRLLSAVGKEIHIQEGKTTVVKHRAKNCGQMSIVQHPQGGKPWGRVAASSHFQRIPNNVHRSRPSSERQATLLLRFAGLKFNIRALWLFSSERMLVSRVLHLQQIRS